MQIICLLRRRNSKRVQIVRFPQRRTSTPKRLHIDFFNDGAIQNVYKPSATMETQSKTFAKRLQYTETQRQNVCKSTALSTYIYWPCKRAKLRENARPLSIIVFCCATEVTICLVYSMRISASSDLCTTCPPKSLHRRGRKDFYAEKL